LAWSSQGGRIRRSRPYDDGQKYALPAASDARASARGVIRGCALSQVGVDEAKADLSLRLTDWPLEFITASGYEAWQLTAPAIEIVAAGVVALNGFRMRPNQRRS